MTKTEEKIMPPAPRALRDDELSGAAGGNGHPVYNYGQCPSKEHAVPGWKPGEGPK